MEPSFKNKVRSVSGPATSSATAPSFASKVRPIAQPAPVEEKTEGTGFFKSLISAPATMVARPFQLAAEAILPGDNTEAIDRFSKEKLGGFVAPVPQNTSDVVKDVGRGVQTVAFGTGAPIAGGAAFGAGMAVENQGSNIFSGEGVKDLAVSTAGGAVGGKILGLIGKPLLNSAGKVIGTITPQIVKDVSAKGAGEVAKFMARHEIVPASVKPAIAQIPKAADKIDESLNRIFTSGGTIAKNAIQSQYPGMTKSNVAKHYENIEIKGIFEPTKVSGKTYNKASDVYNEAKKKGINLEKVAANNKVYRSEMVKDGRFDTTEVADALSSETMSGGPQILRPALAAAEPGVARVPLADIRNEMLKRLGKVPDTKLSPSQKLAFAKKIVNEYGEGSVTASKYKDGYSLTNLYDSKLQTSGSLYKTPKGGGVQSIGDSLTVQQKQLESQVFDDLLRKNVPKELGLDAYFKAQQERFALANYLRTLDGNKAPQTFLQRAVKKSAQLGGATAGASVAGPFGMFSGYQFGGIMADTFASASNPVKIAFLKSIGKSEPEIYAIMKEFVSKSEIDRLFRSKLKAPTTIFQGPTQGGKPFTPNQDYGFRTTPAVETKQKLNSLYTAPDLAKRAAELTKKNGGVTINLKGDVPEKGFAYSPYKDVETIVAKEKFGDTDIDNFIEKHYTRLTQEGHHIGAWEDGGKIYLDISKVNPDESLAAADALMNDQLALFDLSTFETKFMKDYEKINNTYRHKGKK